MARSDFLRAVARAAGAHPNLNPNGAAAHAAHESAWGSSQLATRANNLFGVKAIGSATPYWDGGQVLMPTREYYDGHWVTIDSAFRAYPSTDACLADYADILRRVYPGTVEHAGNVIRWLAVLWLDGPRKWSTDPLIYPAVLMIAQQYGLLGSDAPPAAALDGYVDLVPLNHLTLGMRARLIGQLMLDPVPTLEGGWRWRERPATRGAFSKLDLAPGHSPGGAEGEP